MVAKLWKKICMLILIIACLFNIILKLVDKTPLLKEIESSIQYISINQEKEVSTN